MNTIVLGSDGQFICNIHGERAVQFTSHTETNPNRGGHLYAHLLVESSWYSPLAGTFTAALEGMTLLLAEPFVERSFVSPLSEFLIPISLGR